MKDDLKSILTCFALMMGMIFSIQALAQNYNPVNYNHNGTPTHGIKIKTNIPFQNSMGMTTLMLEGYAYPHDIFDLKLAWYVYNNIFYSGAVVSNGTVAPPITMGTENGKVVIFLDHKKFYQRFTVRAYEQGKGLSTTAFDGWTVVDEPLSSSITYSPSYKQELKGIITMDGYFNSKIGIGTQNPDEILTVKGKIHAQEIKVDLNGAIAPDYVFEEGYDLRSLEEVEVFIKREGHLPGIPSAAKLEAYGVNLKEMNLKLLEKVEELTLYAIGQGDKIRLQEKRLAKQTTMTDALIQRLERLEIAKPR